MTWTQIAKQRLYGVGALTAYHHVRNRHTLTVAMFHRVLPDGDARWPISDPVWTITEILFNGCLTFFRRHYNVVGLADLIAAQERQARLPERALLITFDDGWADSEECALVQLRAAQCPAVVFAVAGGIDGRELWDENLRRRWRCGNLDRQGALMWRKSGETPSPSPRGLTERAALEELIDRIAALEESDRMSIIRDLPADDAGSQLLSTAQLRNLYRNGVAIGSHGLTHAPLPLARDLERELRTSRAILANRLETNSNSAIMSLSFPHGRFDPRTAAEARRAGYKLLFTSDPHINSVREGTVFSDILGRIHIPADSIRGSSGEFRPERLATWLFTRPHAQST